MQIGIIGSRKRKDKKSVYDYVDSLPENTIIVSGGCYGPDKWAEERAKMRGLPEPIIFKPGPAKPGETHYEMVERFYARNRKIAKESDKVVAFVTPDGIERGGTWYTVNYARKLGKPTEIK